MTEPRALARVWAAALILPALCLVGATWIGTSTWERVRTRPVERTIRVVGSARKRIVSDLIQWSARIETRDGDRTESYRQLRKHTETAQAWLRAQGVPAEAIRVSAVELEELTEREISGVGEDRMVREVARGWSTGQTLTVRSTDVALIERVSREITSLLEQGVPVRSWAPDYFYTKLGEEKITMLAEAAADARERAENIVKASGGEGIEGLWDATMGVINVNPANSTSTSWEGNNDTSSLEKDIITIVHLKFSLR